MVCNLQTSIVTEKPFLNDNRRVKMVSLVQLLSLKAFKTGNDYYYYRLLVSSYVFISQIQLNFMNASSIDRR